MATQVSHPRLESLNKPVLRDRWLDALRGLCLIIMTIDHLPSILVKFTYQFIGYVTAAEGFVFLSGFVAGLTYARISFQQTDSIMWRRALLRARTIYLYHIFTFFVLFFTLQVFALDEGYWESWIRLFQQSFAAAILAGVTFFYQPKFLDILPMYCIFVLATPFIIKQFKRNNALPVFGVSIVLWALAQFGVLVKLTLLLSDYLPLYLGDFDIFAWQLLFVVGLYLGFMRYTRSGQQSNMPKALFILFLMVAIALFLSRHHFLFGDAVASEIERITDKRTLGLLRLLNFAAVLFLIAFVYARLKAGFIVNYLAYLGRHSLQVFTFQTLLVCFVNVLLRQATALSETSKVVIVIICVASLYLPAWIDERIKQPTMVPR